MCGILVVCVCFSAADNGRNAVFSHNPTYFLDIYLYFQLFTEVFPHPITPVGLSRAVPDFRDLIRNFPVTISALLLFPPRIIAAARNFEQLTHFGNAVFIFEPLDHSVLQTHLLPASHRKFRNSSFSIRSFTSSLFRFVSSVSGMESLRGRPLGRGT